MAKLKNSCQVQPLEPRLHQRMPIIFMDKLESNFLKSRELTPWLWYRCIDGVFFIWAHGEEKLASFINDLNNYHLALFLLMSLIKNKFHFWILTWICWVLSFLLICISNQLTGINIFTIRLHTQSIRSNLLFTVKLWDWAKFAQKKKILKKIFLKLNHGFHRRDTRKKI